MQSVYVCLLIACASGDFFLQSEKLRYIEMNIELIAAPFEVKQQKTLKLASLVVAFPPFHIAKHITFARVDGARSSK